MTLTVRAPIILLGAGRSGSSLTHSLVARHPAVAWLSALAPAHPTRPWVNGALMRAIDLPVVGNFAASQWPPREVPAFWEAHCRGFARPFRDLVAEDVTLDVQRRLPGVLAQALTERRPRLLVKITGWPRIGFLDRIFPDARFVHVIRDGRAVVNSMIKVPWWLGWWGPSNWRYGPLSPEDEATWRRYDRSFVALAALQWNIVLDALESAGEALPDGRLLTFRYEDLCADSERALLQLCDSADLSASPRLAGAIRRWSISSTNHRWQQDLTAGQQRIITEIMGRNLERYGYL